MLKAFYPEELIESGLVVQKGNGKLEFHPSISRPGTPFLGLRAEERKEPHNFLTPRGMLVGDEPSVVAVLKPRNVWPSATRIADTRRSP